MKKSSLFFTGMAALLLSFDSVPAGCGDSGGNPSDKSAISKKQGEMVCILFTIS
jgi:hypothetical protein